MRTSKLLGLVVLVLLTSLAAMGDVEPNPAKTTAEIQNRIYQAKVFDHGQVQVTYSQGVATLSGTVEDLAAKLAAERAASKVKGVTRVLDYIVVDADVSPAQILEKARHEVLMYPWYGIFQNVQLEAKGHTLIVSGQVTQPFMKSDLGNILAAVPGVAELQNNLEVLPVSAFDDQIRWAVARAIYRDPVFADYANQALPPIHIIVKNGHVTLVGVVASALDRAKAEADARTATTFFSFTNELQVARG